MKTRAICCGEKRVGMFCCMCGKALVVRLWSTDTGHVSTQLIGGRVGVVYGYIRVSTGEQAEHGWSLEAQEHAVKSYLELRQGIIGSSLCGLDWGGIFRDDGVSAFTKAFVTRPAGSALHSRLKPGDHILFPSIDRCVRSVRDIAALLPMWQSMGVTAHFIRDGIDPNTPMGEALAMMIAVFAQLESRLKGERIRAAFAERRRRSLTLGLRPTLGHTIDREGREIPCEDTILTIQKVVELREGRLPNGKRRGWERISHEIRKWRDPSYKIPRFLQVSGSGLEWSRKRCESAYKKFKAGLIPPLPAPPLSAPDTQPLTA